jgi:hypothetical protein
MQCPFCHKEFWGPVYPLHQLFHTRRRSDGQQRDHVTLPPSERDRRSLEGVPQVYYHPQCGAATQMPEKIIRSYLKNPFRYSSTTFCCGCKGYVQDRKVFWVETKQRVSEYMQALQQEAKERRKF